MALEKELAIAQSIVREAAEVLMRIYRTGPQHIARKSTAIDLVTEADIASERLILERLRASFPHDAILGEETGVHGTGQRCWIFDPLDGTTNFAHRLPIFGVSVALVEGNTVLLGVTCDVTRGRLYWATRGGGAWTQGPEERTPRPLRVSHTRSLQAALLATGFPYDKAQSQDNNVAEFAAFLVRAQGIRRAGAATVDMAWLADGRLDGYWEQKLRPWDWAAGALLVQEAGGKVTDYAGNPWTPASTNIVASNGHLHDAMLEVIARVRRQEDTGSNPESADATSRGSGCDRDPSAG